MRGKGTNIGTLPVQTNAFLHHMDMFFLQAGLITMIASLHTAQALVDAFLKLFICHYLSFPSVNWGHL